MRLIYITEGIGPVFQSQIVELLNGIVKKDFFDEVHLCVGLKDLNLSDRIFHLNDQIVLHTFKTYSIYPLLNLMTKISLASLIHKLDIHDNDIVHTRGERHGEFFYTIYKKIYANEPNLLVDIRGAVYEEVRNYLEINKFLKFLKLFGYKKKIRSVLLKAKWINAVTSELRDYIISTYNIKKDNISVIPTIAGSTFCFDKDKRNKIRISLQLEEDEILFVFSTGGSSAWQNDDVIVNELISKGYKVLMLTKKKYVDSKIISRFVPYEEVSSYLNAADIGIIIRNDDIVNNVAAPIKFSEYLASGLPVVANRSVGLINEKLKKSNYGVIIELEDIDDELVKRLIMIDRDKISEDGIETFGINHIVDKYIDLYKGN